MIEHHPLQPFLPINAKILMLGSFPPPHKRWSIEFFYPNFINDMWRIMGLIFHNDKLFFVDKSKKAFKHDLIVQFLLEKGIAIYDTATEVVRLQNNASDKFLEIVTETDICSLLSQMPECKAIVTTGQKASDIISKQLGVEVPAVGESSPFSVLQRDFSFYRMPSSSRAYPLSLENKASYYKNMFQEIGML